MDSSSLEAREIKLSSVSVVAGVSGNVAEEEDDAFAFHELERGGMIVIIRSSITTRNKINVVLIGQFDCFKGY